MTFCYHRLYSKMNDLILDVENQPATGRSGKMHIQQHVNAGQGNRSKSSTRKALGDITNSRLNATLGKSSNTSFPRRQNVIASSAQVSQFSVAAQKVDDATDGATRWMEEPAFSDPVCESVLRDTHQLLEDNCASNEELVFPSYPTFEPEMNLTSKEWHAFEDGDDLKEHYEDLTFPELSLDD
mmetsp:Transcript_35332/g.110446  ORF Transcript_35332/g.110446 Transcript_35332/m.110446 type:complete len:183 (-) Transcript_35332:775-1323(-)